MAEWIGDEVPAEKRKASDVTSRFGNKDFELKTMSKEFVPKSREKQNLDCAQFLVLVITV